MTKEILEILYQDEFFVAINKPSGLLVHRSTIDRKETRFALQLTRDQTGKWIYPAHRLDKPTAGALLFAFSPEAAQKIMVSFSRQKVEKTYLAIVRGFTNDQGEIDKPLREPQDKIVDMFADPNKDPQPALSKYECLAKIELPVTVDRYPTSRYSLVKIKPETGRRHQIRRHMRHIRHPIIGDTTYGEGKHNRYFREHLNCSGLLLAAVKLSFLHPFTQSHITIKAPLENMFSTIIKTFEWNQVVNEYLK